MYQQLIAESIPAELRSEWNLLLDQMNFLGSQEFSLPESEVDRILGDRSYSGGDVPLEVIEEVESKVEHPHSSTTYYFENSQDLTLLKEFLHSNNLAHSVKNVEDEDWNLEWRKHYEPIQVGTDLLIVPSWVDEYNQSIKHKVKIYPGQGFGTGSHETTFLCLKLAQDSARKPTNVLDFGAGSGILGIAMQVVHKSLVDYYDIDESALRNNQQNLAINGIDCGFRLFLPPKRLNLRNDYDLVFANILKPVLLEEASYLMNLTERAGALILSGLLVNQLDEVIRCYENLGGKLKIQETRGEWGALLIEKK